MFCRIPTVTPQHLVDRAHPLGVAAGQVVVDRDDVDALAGERVEDDGERAGQRLALAGLHLGDVAAVQHHAADQLHVEVAHAHRAPADLADDREALRQDLVEGAATVVVGLAAHLLAQRVHPLVELLVGLELQLGLEVADSRDTLLVLAELLRLSDVQRAVKQTHAPQCSRRGP